MLTSIVLFSSLVLLALTSTTTASLLRGHKASVDELVDASGVDDVTEALGEEVGDRLLKKKKKEKMGKKDKGKTKKTKTASTKGSGKGKDGKGKSNGKDTGVGQNGNVIFDQLTPEEEAAYELSTVGIGPVEGPAGEVKDGVACETSRSCASLCCLPHHTSSIPLCWTPPNAYTRCLRP